MAVSNSSQNVFFVDQMARAFLIFAQVLSNDITKKMIKYLDSSIFEPKFTFDKLVDYGYKKDSNDSPASAVVRKRARK